MMRVAIILAAALSVARGADVGAWMAAQQSLVDRSNVIQWTFPKAYGNTVDVISGSTNYVLVGGMAATHEDGLVCGGANDYAISTQSVSELVGTNSLSISMWIRPTNLYAGAIGTVINAHNANASESRLLIAAGNTNVAAIIKYDGLTQYNVTLFGAVTNQKWAFIALVADVSTKTLSIGHNGGEMKSTNIADVAVIDITNKVVIGDFAPYGGASVYTNFQGHVDGVILYRGVKTQNEFTREYEFGRITHR